MVESFKYSLFNITYLGCFQTSFAFFFLCNAFPDFFFFLMELLSNYSKYSQYWASQVVLVVKNPPAKVGDIRDTGSIPGSGRSPGGGHGNPLQYSCLENPMNREPGGLQSMGSKRAGYDWVTYAHVQACMHTRTHTHTHGPCKLPDLEKLKEDFSCQQDFSYSLSCLSTALGITDRWPEIFNTKIIRKPNIIKY